MTFIVQGQRCLIIFMILSVIRVRKMDRKIQQEKTMSPKLQFVSTCYTHSTSRVLGHENDILIRPGMT